MNILRVLRRPEYAVLALGSGMGVLAVYIFSQVLGNLENVSVWIANLSPARGLLVGVFVLLFGVTLAYQLFVWKNPGACSLRKKVTGTSSSGIGTIAIFLVAQCPACASLGTLFLPISTIAFVSHYAVELNILSIGLLFITLHHLGAFQK